MVAWTVDPVNMAVVQCRAQDPSRCRWHGRTDPDTGEWTTSEHYHDRGAAEARAEAMAKTRAAANSMALRKTAGRGGKPIDPHGNGVTAEQYHKLTADSESVASTVASLRENWPDTGEPFEEQSSRQAAMLADVLRRADRFSGLRRWLGEDCDYMELSRCLLSPPIGLNAPCTWNMRPVLQPDGRYRVDLSGWRRALLTTVVNDESAQVPQSAGGEPPSPEGRMTAAILFFKGKCAYCGRPLKRVYYNRSGENPDAASGDHIRPLSPKWTPGKGYDCTFGVTRYGNTVLCCARCNFDKRSYRLKDYMDSAIVDESPGDADRRREAMRRLNEFRRLTGGGRMPREVHSALHGKLRILSAKSRELWAEQEATGGLCKTDLVDFGRLMDLAAEEARFSMGLPSLERKFVDESAFRKADEATAARRNGRPRSHSATKPSAPREQERSSKRAARSAK